MKTGRTALAGIVLLLAACNPQPQPHAGATLTPSPAGVPPLEIVGKGTRSQPVHIMNYDARHRKVYDVLAQSYIGHSAQNFTHAVFSHATVTFYDPGGAQLQASAPAAAIDDARKQVILSGGVHAKTSTELHLTCDRLTYDQRTSLLHGSGHVRIVGDQGGQREVLTGSTFTSDVKLTQMVVR